MPEEKKLTAEEVETMLAQLTDHFHEPVMPITRYCDGLRTWAKCMDQRATSLRHELFPGMTAGHGTPENDAAWKEYRRIREEKDRHVAKLKAGQEFTKWDYAFEELRGYESDSDHLDRVHLLICKSSLLDRLLYGRETLRTEKCPIHKGKWSGLEFTPTADSRIKGNVCPYKCHLTGWIQHPDDTAKWRATVDPKFPENCETCSQPYDNTPSVCSSFFHCCRDCFWLHGQVLYPCKTHIDEWLARQPTSPLT